MKIGKGMGRPAHKLKPAPHGDSLQALDHLTTLLKADLDKVNQVIGAEMHSEVDFIPQLAGHLILAGGKRVRPLLVLAGASLCHYQGTKHIDLAACVEFIHTATLLHDDVVDESNLRRGQTSANALWGNKSSVLVGDFLFSRAFQLMVKVGSLDILKVLSSAAATIAEGEVMQLIDYSNLDIVEQRYFDTIGSKTAALFEAACEIGALLGATPPEKRHALQAYGRSFGMCFQIIDDILDYTASSQQLGKNIGDDFKEGKVTLPVIYAYHRGREKEKAFWEEMFSQQIFDPADLQQALAYLHAHDALTYARSKACNFAQQAIQALDVFEDSDLKTALVSLVPFCLERGY
jgi:octaprenyl-diphosphate synthase